MDRRAEFLDRPAWECVTETVIGCAYKVANALGPGFLEKVYENALAHEVRKAGLAVNQQHDIAVVYDGVVVGHYEPDLMINDTVLVEVKAGKALDNIHMAQCINYLKATGKPVCLLINFGTARIGLRRLLNPAVPQAWMHPADHVYLEPDVDDNNTSPTRADETSTPSIRVHPCSSVVPKP